MAAKSKKKKSSTGTRTQRPRGDVPQHQPKKTAEPQDAWNQLGLILSVAAIAVAFSQVISSIKSTRPATETIHDSSCRFVMDRSTIPDAGWGVFSTVSIAPYEPLLTGEPVIQLPDVLTTQQAGLAFLIHRYSWSAQATGGTDEGRYSVLSIIPGLSMLANSHAHQFNAIPDFPQVHHDGLVRGQSPMAGANTHYHGMGRFAYTPISAGQEILVDYGRGWDDKLSEQLPESTRRSVDFLLENGMCLDNMVPGKTKTMGHGAFAQRYLKAGQIIAPLPLIALDRSSLHIHSSAESKRNRQQLLLNYCYGHTNSSVLLFPYSPVVNLLNHDAQNPNAFLRWSDRTPSTWFQQSASQVINRHESGLLLELVALKPIEPGDQVLIDYGVQYQDVWQEHMYKYGQEPSTDVDYLYAFEANRKWPQLRTVQEQATNPYPSNFQTSCLYQFNEEAIYKRTDTTAADDDGQKSRRTTTASTTYAHFVMDSTVLQPHNLKPCRILERHDSDSDTQDSAGSNSAGSSDRPARSTHYTVEMILSTGEHSRERHIVDLFPREALLFANVPGSTDQHLPNAFRHAIGLPEGVFPEQWMDLASARS